MNSVNQMKYLIISYFKMVDEVRGSEEGFGLANSIVYILRQLYEEEIDMKEIQGIFEKAIAELIEEKVIEYFHSYIYVLNNDLDVLKLKYAEIVWNDIKGRFIGIPNKKNLFWQEDSTENTFILKPIYIEDIAEMIIKNGEIEKYIFNSEEEIEYLFVEPNDGFECSIRKYVDKYIDNTYIKERRIPDDIEFIF